MNYAATNATSLNPTPAVQIAPVPADSIRCGVVSDEEEEEDDDVEKEEGEESDVIATAAPGDRDIWKEGLRP
uniref:Uncharacterized protein n=1 Tax=Pristionchus pacificus TaxID=54126 RepID=A0A2A6CHT0_PRIPA|eukprot:PDM77628.1 hypothetical protein PRIPAC_34495 [Pristionchus pacificus]